LKDKEGGFEGESALKKIKEQHNAIVLNNFNNKNYFGTHYSVNIKPTIL